MSFCRNVTFITTNCVTMSILRIEEEANSIVLFRFRWMGAILCVSSFNFNNILCSPTLLVKEYKQIKFFTNLIWNGGWRGWWALRKSCIVLNSSLETLPSVAAHNAMLPTFARWKEIFIKMCTVHPFYTEMFSSPLRPITIASYE